ncbi:hypothetical protein LCGC14_2802650, partial [marine sediment metagenome]
PGLGQEVYEDNCAYCHVLNGEGEELGPDLTARCRQVFLDRLNYTRGHLPEPWAVPFLLTFHQGWQALDARLFALAAEVAAKTK